MTKGIDPTSTDSPSGQSWDQYVGNRLVYLTPVPRSVFRPPSPGPLCLQTRTSTPPFLTRDWCPVSSPRLRNLPLHRILCPVSSPWSRFLTSVLFYSFRSSEFNPLSTSGPPGVLTSLISTPTSPGLRLSIFQGFCSKVHLVTSSRCVV